MKNLILAALMGLFGFIMPQGAFASVATTYNSYYVDLHFGRTSWNKEVKAVLAHTGVLVTPPDFLGRQPYWTDVKDLKLLEADTGFVGRTALHAEGSDGSVSIKVTPVVQYFIEYADGSREISQVYTIPRNNIINVYYPQNDFASSAAYAMATQANPSSTVVVFGAFDLNGWETIIRLESESGIRKLYP